MISAFVLSPSFGDKPAPRAPEAVARSLGALVRPAIEGVIGDVAIIGPQDESLAGLADHAGCDFFAANSAAEGLRSAFAKMRAPLLFLLEGGFAPTHGFVEEAADIVRSAVFKGAILRSEPETFLARVAPALARPVGALAPRAALTEAPRDLADLIRRARISRVLRVRGQRLV